MQYVLLILSSTLRRVEVNIIYLSCCKLCVTKVELCVFVMNVWVDRDLSCIFAVAEKADETFPAQFNKSLPFARCVNRGGYRGGDEGDASPPHQHIAFFCTWKISPIYESQYTVETRLNRWPWHTPKVITVAVIKWPYTAYHFLFVDCCFNVLEPYSRHYHFCSERDCLWTACDLKNFIFDNEA